MRRRVCLGSLQQQKTGFQKTEIPLWSLGEWKKVLKLYLPKDAYLKVVKKHSSWKYLDIEMKGLSDWIQRQPDKSTFEVIKSRLSNFVFLITSEIDLVPFKIP